MEEAENKADKLAWKFDPAKAYAAIARDWEAWAGSTGCEKFVIGISGGKDSTVLAALAVKIFGTERVVGVSMPYWKQDDMADVDTVFAKLAIKRYDVDVGAAVDSLEMKLEANGVELTEMAAVNLPPRIRTATLFLVAQCVGGMPMNTGNLSEATVGYSTFGGDDFGCYAPLMPFTASEVVAIGDWLGLSRELTHKVPADGLQADVDEDRLGFKYADLDKFIRTGEATAELKEKVRAKWAANKFKTDIIQLPKPDISDLGLVNYVAG